MAKTKVTLSGEGITYFRPKDLKVGETISGEYLGTIVDRFQNTGHKLKLADGSIGILNGAGQLNALLAKVAVGSSIDIVYQGKNVMTKGQFKGAQAHSFDVYTEAVEDSDTPAVETSSDDNLPFS